MSSSKTLFSLPAISCKVAAAIALLGAVSAAQAVVVFNVTQVGANVVITGSGSLLTTGFGATALTNFLAASTPSTPMMSVGLAGNTYARYAFAFSASSGFGSFTPVSASSGTGDDFGFDKSGGFLYVPTGYLSGAALSGTATFNNTTIAAMGFTPGNYSQSYSFPFTGDSFAVIVAAAPVPEPGSVALMLAGLAGVGLLTRTRARG